MKNVKKICALLFLTLFVSFVAIPVFSDSTDVSAAESTEVTTTGTAQEDDGSSIDGVKAIAAGVAIGLAAAGGALGMGLVGGKSAEGISRQPDIESKIRTTLMLTMVFIETAIIYALLVVILIIFVL